MTTSKGRERKITIVSLSQSKINFEGRTSLDDEDQESLDDSVSTIDEALSCIDLEKELVFIKKCIKGQCKQLVKLFLIFCIYIIFGMFVFFYIEECSGATKPDDNSYIHKDRSVDPELTNSTHICIELIDSFDNHRNETHNSTFESTEILSYCQMEFQGSMHPVITKFATKGFCHIDAFLLLKYAEFTIFTCLTIGYGNTTPETIVGRIILIFYAIVGMPLALTMYSVAGKLVVQIITYILNMIQSRVRKKPTEEVKHLQLKNLVISVVLFILIILAGSGVTSAPNMENLAYSSSFYFWFISLSTIGYGDITFKRDQHLKSPHMMMVAVLILLFGIGILAAIIAAISLVLEKRDLKMSTIIIDNDEENLVENEESNQPSDVNENFFPHKVLEGLRNREERVSRQIVDDDEQTCITQLSSEESLNDEPNRNHREKRVTSSIVITPKFTEDTLMLLKRRKTIKESKTDSHGYDRAFVFTDNDRFDMNGHTNNNNDVLL